MPTLVLILPLLVRSRRFGINESLKHCHIFIMDLSVFGLSSILSKLGKVSQIRIDPFMLRYRLNPIHFLLQLIKPSLLPQVPEINQFTLIQIFIKQLVVPFYFFVLLFDYCFGFLLSFNFWGVCILGSVFDVLVDLEFSDDVRFGAFVPGSFTARWRLVVLIIFSICIL